MTPPTVSRLLRHAGLPALLVCDRINVQYLSGLSMSNGFVLIKGKNFTLYTDDRYLENAKKSKKKGWIAKSMGDLEKDMHRVKRCGINEETTTMGQMRRMKRKFKNTKFVQTSGVIEEFRRTKTSEELRYFRRAQRITKELLLRVPGVLRKGITERELAWKLETWARELGAEELSFEPIVAFGTHTSHPHHHPTNRRLLKGHIVQVDVGARYRGYCADQSAVFFTKKPTPLQQRVYSAVERAKEAAVNAVRPGVTTHKLDEIARAVLAEEGLNEYFGHALGHGVGLEIHEGPSISGRAPLQKLKKNEIVTIEPGVYLPGRFGVRLEEEIVV